MEKKKILLGMISGFLIVIMVFFVSGITTISDELLNTSGDVIATNVNASGAFYEGGVALSSTYSPIAGSSSVVTVGTIASGIWQGTSLSDTYVSNSLTMDYTGLQNYPSACPAGEYVSAIADTLTCSAPAGGGDMLKSTYDTNTNNIVDNAESLACSDCVALGTETTGNYATSSSEGGDAIGLVCTGCVGATDLADSFDDCGDCDATFVNEAQANSISSGMVAFNYAASSSEGGAANGLACTTCVSTGEVDFNWALGATKGGNAAIANDLSCTNCIGGTEISELGDGDISNTLTCSNLVTGSSVVSDAEVDNDITASNYLPLSGGTMTGDITLGSNLLNLNNAYIHSGTARDIDIQMGYDGFLGIHPGASVPGGWGVILNGNFSMIPAMSGTWSIGTSAVKFYDIYTVNTHAGDIIFANNITLTECGQAMCFKNQTDSTIMRIEPNGDFQIRGTITENYDFGD